METEERPRARTLRCVRCGSENIRDALRCWCCNKEDWREDDDSDAPPYPIGLYILRGAIVLFGLLALGLFLRFRSPMAAIVLLCIVVPALLISEVQALRCRRWGVQFTSRDRLLTLFKCAIVLTPLVIFATLAALVLFGAARVGEAWSHWLTLP
jgi:hypothetical protein